MPHKTSHKNRSVKSRGEYLSKADFIQHYYCNMQNCIDFFFSIKWPTGYVCEKCGCTHYYFMKSKNCYRCAHCHHDERLLTHTCFQDNKLPLNVLMYGLFLIFYDKRSISSFELAEELKVNYKTACLLQTKCRILMKESNSRKKLDSFFYEADVAYTGTPSGKAGMGTDKQPYLAVLSTKQENQYPLYIKLKEIDSDQGEIIHDFFKSMVIVDHNRTLNTDGKTTYNSLKKDMIVKNEKIDYEEDNHRLWYLNKIISNFNSLILGKYHGVDKRMLPLYFSEFEWRFNHRHTTDFITKIMHYIQFSFVMTRKSITAAMDAYALKRGVISC